MDPLGECPAVEVFKFRDKDGYFGQVLTSITRYFGQVIAPSIKDSTATHIPFNRQRVAYHWNVMNFNGKRESFKGSVWWSAFPSSASVELKSRKSKRQCEQYFLCSEPRTQGRAPSSRSVSGWPSSQTQAVRPLTIHNRFTWKFTHGVTKFGYTFTFWQVGLQRSHHRLGWNRCLVKMPLTEKALTFSCGGGTLPLDKSCSYMVNGRRPQGGGETIHTLKDNANCSSGSCLLVGRDAQRKPNLARPTKLCSVGKSTQNIREPNPNKSCCFWILPKWGGGAL